MLKISIVLTLFTGIFILSSYAPIKNNEQFVVVIDAGHGGMDPGNINEKNINLQIAKNLLALSNDQEVKIILTRETDKFISLDERIKFINIQNPNLALSIHSDTDINSDGSRFEAHYFSKNKFQKKSKSFSKILIEEQLKEENDKGEVKSANFIFLKNSSVPAVLLEFGIESNKVNFERLNDEKYQKLLAFHIYEGLKRIKSMSNK